MECGCAVTVDHVILYCHLHKAAADMRAALENIEARLMSADCDPDDTREQNWHCGLLGYVGDTLAAVWAEG